MTFNLLPGNSDMQGLVTNMNQTISELKDQDHAKVFKDDSGTPVVIIDADGLRTTQPGSSIDVTTASDSQLSFDSRRDQLKVVGTGTFTMSKLANSTSKTGGITHNLGFIPIVIAAYNTGDPSANGFLPKTTVGLSDGTIQLLIEVQQSDASNVIFAIRTPSTGAFYTSQVDVSIKYYLFQETAV